MHRFQVKELNGPAIDRPRSIYWRVASIGFPVLIAGVACLAIISPVLTAAWELNRAAIADGEWTRLITGHWTHWSVDHLFWDAATFVVLAIMCMRRRPLATIACLVIGSLAISAGVLQIHQELDAYRGLSGLDTALFALLAVLLYQDARRQGDRALAAVAKWGVASLIANTVYELFTGETLFVNSSEAGFIPLASAHAIGAAIGLLVGLFAPITTLLFATKYGQGHSGLLAISTRPAILQEVRTARLSVD